MRELSEGRCWDLFDKRRSSRLLLEWRKIGLKIEVEDDEEHINHAHESRWRPPSSVALDRAFFDENMSIRYLDSTGIVLVFFLLRQVCRRPRINIPEGIALNNISIFSRA
jgi:hypothetical protein